METRKNSTTRVEVPAWNSNRVQTTTGRLVEQQHGSTLNQRAARRNPIVAGTIEQSESLQHGERVYKRLDKIWRVTA
jgi:hypothetical protein